MKRLLLFSLGLLLAGSGLIARTLVDTTIARVNGDNIYLSDLREPQVNAGGQARTIDQCVDEMLFYQKAKAYNMTMLEEDVNKRISALKKGQGFGYQSNDEYEAVLQDAGLTLKRLSGQIRRLGAMAEMKHVLVPKDFFASPAEIKEYCKNNPLYRDESYQLSFAIVEKDMIDENRVVKPDEVEELDFEFLEGLVTDKALADNMQFVASLEEDEIGAAIERNGVWYVYRLDKKHPRHLMSIDERTPAVKQFLVDEKRKNAGNDVIKTLREQASIKVFSY